jgi:hypothetical protein
MFLDDTGELLDHYDGGGHVLALGQCFNCRRVFAFNPVSVPSINIHGEREPICQPCVTLANVERRKNGVPEIVPEPDAYEPCPEEALS